MQSAARRRLRKSAQQEAKRILFPLTSETPQARAKWPEKRSSSETAMSIFLSTMLGSFRSGLRMKRRKKCLIACYGSSKAAINLLTKTWAAEYGPSGVRVNAVSPGPTRTEGTDAMGEGLEQLAAQAPAGRPATSDEIAEAIVFLATDRASFIHGAKLAVDGGRTAV